VPDQLDRLASLLLEGGDQLPNKRGSRAVSQ
jgi:hypothetical protein